MKSILSENKFIGVLEYIKKYNGLFNLLINPVDYDPDEEIQLEENFKLYGEEYDSYDKEILTHCTACNFTGDMLIKLFTKNELQLNQETELLKGVKVNTGLNGKQLHISTVRKLHVFKDLIIEWLSLYQFIKIDIEFIVDWHVFIIIYYNEKIYVLQSYEKKHNLIIDVYDYVDEVIDLIIDIYDDNDQEILQKFFHINENFGNVNDDIKILKDRRFITLEFQPLIIPDRNKILKFLTKYKKNLTNDPVWINEYTNAIKDVL